MITEYLNWDELVYDSKPEGMEGYESLGIGDIDGDGELEAVCGGGGGLYWYRIRTAEKGIIAMDIYNSVGICCRDIDGDGEDEIFIAEAPYKGQKNHRISWFDRVDGEWVLHVLDPDYFGTAHDIIFSDIDGDGEEEMLALSCYTAHHGIFLYKRNQDITKPWNRYTVEEIIHPRETPYAEGLSCGDLNQDGRLEIVNGPYYYLMPSEGPYSGTWERVAYADDFREMCRTNLFDITGNNTLDIIITDSEFMDGKLSWFENCGVVDGRVKFKEHVLADDLYYSHTLQTYEEDGRKYILTAEMEKGGWDAYYNYDARIIRYATEDNGKEFRRQILKSHEGTHEAKAVDLNRDGKVCIIGKTLGRDNTDPRVQLFKPPAERDRTEDFKHVFIDRYKPYPSTDIMSADIDGNGKKELICGKYWYETEGFGRFEIPGINQIINHMDIDGDGIEELIAITGGEEESEDTIFGVQLVLMKAVDAKKGIWKTGVIGRCSGDWPHGSAIDRFGADGQIALVIANHSCNEGKKDYPQIFIAPEDPFASVWEARVIAEVMYGEELVVYDIDEDGLPDIIAGRWWLKNNGDFTFTPYELYEDSTFHAARIVLADVNGDGKEEIVMCEESLDYQQQSVFMGRIIWLERPENLKGIWPMHPVDTMRSPHSLGTDVIDGNVEIYAAEHDPFYPYRNRGRVYVYRPVDNGKVFKKSLLDHRFEHHDGMKVVDFIEGKQCIVSHSWTEFNYVHLWMRDK